VRGAGNWRLHFYVRCSRSVKKRGLTPQAAEVHGF
jgi:hypothetical protein